MLSLSPGCPCPSPGAEHRALRSIPFPPGAECPLGAGVTQSSVTPQSSQEREIHACAVLHMLTWPLQESLQGVSPVELVASKIRWESKPGMCKSQGITGSW